MCIRVSCVCVHVYPLFSQPFSYPDHIIIFSMVLRYIVIHLRTMKHLDFTLEFKINDQINNTKVYMNIVLIH